jgi:hypothetical protein
MYHWSLHRNDYVMAANDLPIFSLAPAERPGSRARAQKTADRLHAILDGGRMPFDQRLLGLGTCPLINKLILCYHAT